MSNFQEALKTLKGVRVARGESINSALRSERINAIIDAIHGLARGDNFGRGKGIRKRTGPGNVILTSDASGEDGGGGGPTFPFQVTDTIKDGYTAIQVEPGFMLNWVPYIDGTLMDQLVYNGVGELVPNTITAPSEASPRPPTAPPVIAPNYEAFLWLITRIKLSSPNYHPVIDLDPATSPVKPPAESLYLTFTSPEIADAVDFRIKWDDPTTKVAGGFPIKLATVVMKPAGAGVTTGPEVVSIRQHIYDSFRAIVLAGNDIIPIG